MEMSSIEYVAGLVEMTNFFSLATVLLCFLCMVIFILRLSADQWNDNTQNSRVLPCQIMQSVSCPITFQLVSQSLSNYGVTAEVYFSSKGIFQSFWGVDVKKLSQVMCLEWSAFYKQFMDDSLLEGCYFHKDIQQCIPQSSNGKKMCLLRESSSYNFGDYRGLRTRYPLVAIQILLDPPAASVVCVITVIHIQDANCTLESQILTQFVRTTNSKFIQLTPMFVSRSMDAEPRPTRPEEGVPATRAPAASGHQQPPGQETGVTLPSTDSGTGETVAWTTEPSSSAATTHQELRSECVVCQSAPVHVVVLPCRHACICDTCFSHLTKAASGYAKCPLCRTFIGSFFRLARGDEGPPGDLTGTQSLPGHRVDRHSPSLYTRLLHFNDKLNRLFGFE